MERKNLDIESINYYSRVSFCNRKINRATTSREKPGREFYLFDFVYNMVDVVPVHFMLMRIKNC